MSNDDLSKRQRTYRLRQMRVNRYRAGLHFRSTLAGLLSLICCLVISSIQTRPIAAHEPAVTAPCHAEYQWPVDHPTILKAFSNPPQPWLSGHRGVDLDAEPGLPIRAPAKGSIAFAGQVAGKSVVSLKHEKATSTFEPASTELKAGSKVRKGEVFAKHEGGSDHCGDHCLHWGLRSGPKSYLDPASRVTAKLIGLKPPLD
ncbi:hypothetical protein CRD60_02220 [Bifidobacterium aemilianum]|uniref:M23ase beta-sheet core domain-containing protein n=1 Tax=Bifidobacterium aemilianum TaxID=2493120 RepID=A0A366K8L3_9BIFI|nr:M23 family metallopeptidase [Bifidobacterium aemilianum]RBP98014.1 hypothetical protein CRD60_02220 [Bifidobacterium aemilianum]